MAKKTSNKKVAKKSSQKKKTAKPKVTNVKKAAPKKAFKKSVVKKTAAKKTTAKKQAVKKAAPKKKQVKEVKKAVIKKPDQKVRIIHEKPKKVVRRKKHVEETQFISTAESRAEALKKIKGYGQKDLEHFRAIILEKRDEIIEQLQNLREQMLDPTTGEYINENSPYSLHMAEQGTDAMEREKTFLYAQRENKFLGYLEDALKRIDNGTYGICVECIEEPQHLCDTCPLIPKARLEAVPHSQLCLPMKQKQEKK